MRRKIPNDTSYFHFYDANPKNKRTGDCVVRAISLATNQSWDEVLTGLFHLSLKYKQMLDCPELYDKYLKSLGYIKQPMIRKFDGTKYTGEEFCQLNTNNDYPIIIHIGSHHLSCIYDGRIWDTWNCSKYCVGNFWVKI